MWGISGDTMFEYNKSWVEKVEKDHVRNLDYITISLQIYASYNMLIY